MRGGLLVECSCRGKSLSASLFSEYLSRPVPPFRVSGSRVQRPALPDRKGIVMIRESARGPRPETERHQPTFRFGVFELNRATGELRKHGVKLKLQDQPAQILALLLEHPGEVVTREEIRKRLWPEQ